MAERSRRASGVLALAVLAASFQVAAQEQAVAAVWKVREVDFLYRSSVAIFTCDALQGRVAAILRGVGARDDVQVRVDDCSSFIVPSDMPSEVSSGLPTNTWDTGNRSSATNTWQTPSSRFSTRSTGREQTSHVRVRLLFPTQVTPEVLVELDRDKSRRELVSRVTGNPAARLDDPVVFEARRQVVTLSSQTIGLSPVECELLEQISTSVFRELDVRIVHKSTSCGRNSISRIPPKLTVESLIGIPFGTGAIQQAPAGPATGSATGDAADPGAPPAPSGDAPPSEPVPGTTPR